MLDVVQQVHGKPVGPHTPFGSRKHTLLVAAVMNAPHSKETHQRIGCDHRGDVVAQPGDVTHQGCQPHRSDQGQFGMNPAAGARAAAAKRLRVRANAEQNAECQRFPGG